MIGTWQLMNPGEHLLRHLHKQFIRRWMDCRVVCKDTPTLKRHMERVHKLQPRATPLNGMFCKPCRMWFSSQYDWEDHKAKAHNPALGRTE